MNNMNKPFGYFIYKDNSIRASEDFRTFQTIEDMPVGAYFWESSAYPLMRVFVRIGQDSEKEFKYDPILELVHPTLIPDRIKAIILLLG